MSSWLLFLLKSTLIFSLLYMIFMILMRKETFFRLKRITLLLIIIISVIIPFIPLPGHEHPVLSLSINSGVSNAEEVSVPQIRNISYH